MDIFSTKQTSSPRLKHRTPSWWDSFCTRRANNQQCLQSFRLTFGPEEEQFTCPDLQSHHILYAKTAADYRKLRLLSLHPDYAIERYGYALIYCGQRYFQRIPGNATVFECQNLYYLAHDIIASRKRTRDYLCRYSACRYYQAPLLFSPPEVHLGRFNQISSGHPRPLLPKQEFGTAVSMRWHRHEPNIEIVSSNDVRVTSILQTLLDTLASMPAPDFIVPGDYLLRLLLKLPNGARRVDQNQIAQIRRNLLRLASSLDRRGSMTKIEQRFDMLCPLAESPLESLMRFSCISAGLPKPIVQFPLQSNGDNPTYFIDMAWPQYGLAIEVDGLAKYSSEEDIRQEKNRENKLYMSFPHVRRLTWDTLTSWEEFISVLNTAFR